jgi:hypothetical protein
MTRGLTLLRCGHVCLLALDDFLRAELRDAFDQLHGDGLGQRKAERPFVVDFVRREFVLERCDKAIAGGVERVVLLPPEPAV